MDTARPSPTTPPACGATRPPRLAVLALALATLLPACEGAEGSGGTGTFDLDAGASAQDAAERGGDAHSAGQGDAKGADGTDAPDASPGIDLSALIPAGRYATRQRLSTLMKLPPAGTEAESVNTALSLHEVSHTGGQTRVTSTTCAMSQPKMSGVQTVFSDAFVAGIPVWEASLSATRQPDGSVRLQLPLTTIVFGAKLADPEADPLPTKVDDATVIDPDKDGKPGATVKLTGLISGEIYVVQRRSSGFDGTFDEATKRAKGLLPGEVEQVVVGASEPVLQQLDLSAKTNPDKSKSTFVWVDVDDTLDCKALAAQADKLFAD